MIQIPDSKFPLELKKIVEQKKIVKEYSSEGLLQTNDSMTLMSIVSEEAHAVLLSSY
jgi:hypothetical protein